VRGGRRRRRGGGLSRGREIAGLPYPFDQNSEPWATHTLLYSHPLAGFDFVSPVNTDEHGDGANFARMLNEHSHINERQKTNKGRRWRDKALQKSGKPSKSPPSMLLRLYSVVERGSSSCSEFLNQGFPGRTTCLSLSRETTIPRFFRSAVAAPFDEFVSRNRLVRCCWHTNIEHRPARRAAAFANFTFGHPNLHQIGSICPDEANTTTPSRHSTRPPPPVH